MLELIVEILPYIASICACVIAFIKGKRTLTPDEIEAKTQAKAEKYRNKLCKKNKVTPVESCPQTFDTVTKSVHVLEEKLTDIYDK